MHNSIYEVFANLFHKHNISINKNKYFYWYCDIIFNAKQRKSLPEVIENHHFIPKSCSNLDETVPLSPKEHYIAHMLMPKFLLDIHKYKMMCAFNLMVNIGHYKPTSRHYNLSKQYRKEVSHITKRKSKPKSKTYPKYLFIHYGWRLGNTKFYLQKQLINSQSHQLPYMPS